MYLSLLIFFLLNEIAKEQVQKVNEVGGNALFLNTDVKNREQVIKTAKTGDYITSPELASSPSFRSLLQEPSFKKQLALVVVDEAHLIVHWGKKLRTYQYICDAVAESCDIAAECCKGKSRSL